MPQFDYGYFTHSRKKVGKVDQSKERKELSKKRTIKNKLIANEFDENYYDGSRINGYGGFRYDGRWRKFLPKIIRRYKLNQDSKVLDLGCKKGFFLKDLEDLVPKIKIYGVEDHNYPVKNSLQSVRKKIKIVSTYYDLKYPKKYFDFVHAHNSIYYYPLRDLIKILRKISYISKNSHITIPTYNNEQEFIKFKNWSLVGPTIFKKNEWIQIFNYCGYKGDYFFSGPKSYGL